MKTGIRKGSIVNVEGHEDRKFKVCSFYDFSGEDHKGEKYVLLDYVPAHEDYFMVSHLDDLKPC